MFLQMSSIQVEENVLFWGAAKTLLWDLAFSFLVLVISHRFDLMCTYSCQDRKVVIHAYLHMHKCAWKACFTD